MAHVVDILTTATPQEPMRSRGRVEAVPGRGLEGDRYFLNQGTFSPHPQKPDFELTLIQQEHIEAFVQASGLPFTAADARRNIVTLGVDLNALVEKNFFVGPVEVRGIRLCEPCNYLAKITHREVLAGLVHKGGLRAQILSAGVIQKGDPIRLSDDSAYPPAD